MRMFANLKLTHFYSGVRTDYKILVYLNIIKDIFFVVVISAAIKQVSQNIAHIFRIYSKLELDSRAPCGRVD